MENYPEQQETGNTGVSNINVPMNDDDVKVVTEHLFINTAVFQF